MSGEILIKEARIRTTEYEDVPYTADSIREIWSNDTAETSLVLALLEKWETSEQRLGFSRDGVSHWTAEAERYMKERDALLVELGETRAQRDAAIMERDELVEAVICGPFQQLLGVSATTIERDTAEAIAKLAEVEKERDEWRTQHENLVEVRRADLVAVAARAERAERSLEAAVLDAVDMEYAVSKHTAEAIAAWLETMLAHPITKDSASVINALRSGAWKVRP